MEQSGSIDNSLLFLWQLVCKNPHSLGTSLKREDETSSPKKLIVFPYHKKIFIAAASSR